MGKDVLSDLVKRFRGSIFPKAYLEKAKEAIKEGDFKIAKFLLERVLEIEPSNQQVKKLLRTISSK